MLTELRWVSVGFRGNWYVEHYAVKTIDLPFVPAHGMDIATGKSIVSVDDVTWNDNLNKFIVSVHGFNVDDEWREVDSFEE